MQTNYLKYFVDVAELGSVTAAAKRNFISTQGLSRSLGVLESELGCELFQRRQNGMELTTYGKRLLQQAKQILSAENGMHDTVLAVRDEETRTQGESLYVYLNNVIFDASFFRPVMEAFANTLPRGSHYFQCSNEEVVEHLLSSDVPNDCKIGWLCLFSPNEKVNADIMRRLRDAGYVYQPYLRSHDMVLVSESSDLATCTSLTDAEILKHPLACAGGDILHVVQSRFGAKAIAVVTNDSQFRFDMVARNQVISFIPAFQLLSEDVPGTVAIPMKEPYYLELGTVVTPEFRSEKRNDFLRRLTSYYTQFEGSPHFSFASDIYTGFGFDPATEPFDRNRAITNVEDAADISPRERDVFEQLAKGASTDEISGKLYISKATVKSHINSIYKKLGIHSHDDLLRAVDEEQRRLLGQAGR